MLEAPSCHLTHPDVCGLCQIGRRTLPGSPRTPWCVWGVEVGSSLNGSRLVHTGRQQQTNTRALKGVKPADTQGWGSWLGDWGALGPSPLTAGLPVKVRQ